MQSIFRCGNAFGLVLLLGLVCSPFQPAYPASPTSESAAMAPDQAMEGKILQHIQYGTPIVTEDAATAAVAEKASDNSSAKADVSDYPPEYGTGEIHVKLRAGWRLDRSDHVTRITKEGQIQYPEELLYLDYEFPESSIAPLWGPVEPLLELKARGEKLSGQSLPDLSLWYSIKPDPTFSSVKMIGTEEVADYRLPDFMAEATRRAVEILRTMPGVESIRVAAPMVRSSWPSFSAGDSPNWVPYELHAAPDVYNADGDYGEYNLAISDLSAGRILQADPTDGDYDYYYYPPLNCKNGKCPTGGLNIWPAWSAPTPFLGDGVAIGYIEEDWCLDTIADGDVVQAECSTHEDLQSLYSNHISYLTSSRVPSGGLNFNYWHGTAVLGIMAADHNNFGTSGIAPNADYYIGQAWNTSEWITLVQKIIEDGRGDGAMFMVIPLGCFNSGGLATCPAEVHPEIMQFVRTLTANNFVVVTIPGNSLTNLDNPGDYDYDDDNAFTDFEYPDGDIDWSSYETPNNGYQTLNRAASSYIDSGSIVASAGTAQDWTNSQYYGGDGDDDSGLTFSRRSRETFASYGSRVDLQARGSADATTAIPPYPNQQPIHLYGFFGATSACWPQVTASAALVQQMYKTLPLKANGQAGDFLTSIRMRNALVENGNPQVPMDVDPNWVHFLPELQNRSYNYNFNTGSYLGSGIVPSSSESPAEPFARIGPRPDLGRVMYTFGLADESGNATSSWIPRYKLAFENHQYAVALRLWCVPNFLIGGCLRYIQHNLPVFIPSEPFSRNYLIPEMFNSSDWQASLIRSPRIAGGFALNLGGTPSIDRSLNKYLQIHDSQGFESSYFHPNGGANGRASFTLSAWVNIAEQQTYANQYVFYKQDSDSKPEYGMYINAAKQLCIDLTMEGATTKSTTCSTATLSTNRVYYLAAIISQSATQTFVMPYIDGVKTQTSPSVFTGTRLRSVDAMPEVGLGFIGTIDEIAYEREAFPNPSTISYRSLTLERRFLEGANPPGLIASWQFDVKDAAMINDPVSGYNGCVTPVDGDLDIDMDCDSEIAASTLYNKWGAGVPIGSFYNVNNVLFTNAANLTSLGSTFSIETYFKAPVSGPEEQTLVERKNSTATAWKVVWTGGQDAGQIILKVTNASGQTITVKSNNLTNSTQSGIIPVMKSSWIHAVITYDGVNKLAKIYANNKDVTGQITGQSSWAPRSLSTPVYVTIGSNWPKEVSFVRVYSSVISTSAVKFSTGETRDDIEYLYKMRSSLWSNGYFKTISTP